MKCPVSGKNKISEPELRLRLFSRVREGRHRWVVLAGLEVEVVLEGHSRQRAVSLSKGRK